MGTCREGVMTKAATRKYSSPLREQQANRTKEAILAATERLLLSCGYAKTTIEAIATEANVSPQTIYVIFKNKRGIMREVLAQAFNDAEGQDALDRTLIPADVHERIRLTVEFIMQGRKKEDPKYDILRNAGILSPELSKIIQDFEKVGRSHQAAHTRFILHGAQLKPGLTMEKAVDITWYITHREGYQTLVMERGWSHEEYAQWLYDTLVTLLLGNQGPSPK